MDLPAALAAARNVRNSARLSRTRSLSLRLTRDLRPAELFPLAIFRFAVRTFMAPHTSSQLWSVHWIYEGVRARHGAPRRGQTIPRPALAALC